MLSLFKRPDLKKGADRARECGGVLVDVRTPSEYAEGHLPGAVNIPLDRLDSSAIPAGKLFVYCYSGARSARAVSYLKGKGRDAENIGGIAGYGGPIERGV